MACIFVYGYRLDTIQICHDVQKTSYNSTWDLLQFIDEITIILLGMILSFLFKFSSIFHN